jgi:hypothetical protein
MMRRAGLTQALGVISLLASLLAALATIWITAARGPKPAWVLCALIAAGLGLLTGVAGLIASRGLSRAPQLAIVGCVLSLPSVFVETIISLFVFGGH